MSNRGKHAAMYQGKRLEISTGTLKIVVVGHVDHGKSSLIGRLLHETDSLPPGKLEEIRRVSASRGMPIEWSFVLDAFQAERDQAVTIDTTQIWFKSAKRHYVIIDAPGHREFLKNMVSGAANADAALLVIDANEGLREQSRRHAYLLHMLGIRQVAVIVNKMDLVDYSEQHFIEIAAEITHYLGDLNIAPVAIVPVSARAGDNIAANSPAMKWYQGGSIIETLDRLHEVTRPRDQPLRIPVQDVYKFDERRIIVGRIESGILRVGDELLFSPSNKSALVRTIESWNARDLPVEAHPGEAVGFTLDEPIFIERGEVASHRESPPILTTVCRATVFWLGAQPPDLNRTYRMRIATQENTVSIQSIDRVIDTDTLASRASDTAERDSIVEITLRSRGLMAVDEYGSIATTGRFVLVDGYDTVAGGVISMEGYPDQRPTFGVKSENLFSVVHRITAEDRATRNGHRGGVLWLTGLSGAGKSTLSIALEQRLFLKGYHVYVLDGDNIRQGLSANLGFAPEDRTENIRRIGEVAALFADAGFLCITAFISPYIADRERARAAAKTAFHEVYVKADLETCERRDPKGLYRRARAGEIAEFTGISAPYEPPLSPELTVDAGANSIEECVAALTRYVERVFRPNAAHRN